MAPVSRTTTATPAPHDIINCKKCMRVRLVQVKNHCFNGNSNSFNSNDANDNRINIHHASK